MRFLASVDVYFALCLIFVFWFCLYCFMCLLFCLTGLVLVVCFGFVWFAVVLFWFSCTLILFWFGILPDFVFGAVLVCCLLFAAMCFWWWLCCFAAFSLGCGCCVADFVICYL